MHSSNSGMRKKEMPNWDTLPVSRTVLFAAHTVPGLDRLQDIALLLEDRRVQPLYTHVPGFLGDGVDRRLHDLRDKVIPWSEATERQVDLVVGASPHRLEDVPARKRFAVPQGAGFTKLWRPDSFSPLDGRGRPVLDALMLPHPEHPAAFVRQPSVAVVTGDPCYDRLARSADHRERYRAKLGVRDGQVLVVVASAWGQQSLLVLQGDLLRRLPVELPANHRVIATVHPAVWSEHGVRTVRRSLREVHEAGVDLVDAWEDWRGLVVAADVVIADHSSLAVYAAAIGVPVVLSHFPSGEVDPGSVLATLAACSPRLRRDLPLHGQLLAARNAQPAQMRVVGDRVAAKAGNVAGTVRETLYRLLKLPEPRGTASWPLVEVPRLVQDEHQLWPT